MTLAYTVKLRGDGGKGAFGPHRTRNVLNAGSEQVRMDDPQGTTPPFINILETCHPIKVMKFSPDT